MRRRLHWILEFALVLRCCTGSLARAQDLPVIPLIVDRPAAPESKTAEPLMLNDAKGEVKISPNTAMPRLGAPQEQKIFTLAELALKSSDYIDVRYIANSAHPDDLGLFERGRDYYGDQIHRLVSDYKNFYSSENLLYVGLAVGVAAPLANTHADQTIRDWYQRGAGQGRSRGLDNTALFVKNFGETKYAIPGYLVLSGSGFLWPDNDVASALGDFGNRGLRALAVGAPALGILQVGLGSDRPSAQDSGWHPFRSSHGASGHAFVGAIPFLTAASMTDSPVLQTLLVAASFGPAWSRIHTDDHYFSQVLLGWSIACLSVRSVNQTENDQGRFHIVPCDIPKGVGMGVQVSY
jgi:hypothetical protein